MNSATHWDNVRLREAGLWQTLVVVREPKLWLTCGWCRRAQAMADLWVEQESPGYGWPVGGAEEPRLWLTCGWWRRAQAMADLWVVQESPDYNGWPVGGVGEPRLWLTCGWCRRAEAMATLVVWVEGVAPLIHCQDYNSWKPNATPLAHSLTHSPHTIVLGTWT